MGLFKQILFRKLGAVEGAALAEEFVGVVGLFRTFPCTCVGDQNPTLSVREAFYIGACAGKRS